MILTLVLLTTACGDSDASGPPEIIEGRTECDECHMIIDDVRFAAAYRLPDGAELRFDDIGDMLARGHRTGELAEADAWVFDYHSGEPLPAEQATFVVSAEVLTPMGWGVAAFEDSAAAGDVAEPIDADVVGWEELMGLFAEGGVGGHLENRES